MKKILLFVVCTLVAVSCGHRYSGSNGEKTQKDAEKEFIKSLTDQAKEAAVEKGDRCMQLLKDGEIDKALEMIYVLYDDVVYAKSDKFTEELKGRFTAIPVCDFKRDYVSFSTQGNNDLSYVIEFAPRTSPDETVPTMKLMFNPVYVDGEWYLTMKDAGQSSKALPADKQIHELAPAPKEITLNKK